MVTPKEIGRRKLERPFRPFRVIMKNGEVFDIPHDLDFMALHDGIDLPVEYEGDIPKRGVFRRYEDIERLEPLEREVRHGR